MSDEHIQLTRTFLNKCAIVFDDFSQLEGMEIPRDILLNEKRYNEIQEDIQNMKKIYSSGSLTCLQKNAKQRQKWPLLNLVRQILKCNSYEMHPIRKSNGYTPEGKKKYLRFFIIKKIKSIKEKEQEIKEYHNVVDNVVDNIVDNVVDNVVNNVVDNVAEKNIVILS